MSRQYKRNHVLSECLLERFQDGSGNIVRYDVIRNKRKLTKPGLEGFRLNLWRKTSARLMETLWNRQAENDIQNVLMKIDLRKRITKTDLGVLARFCAMHFVRSNEFIELYEYIRQQKANVSVNTEDLDFTNKYRVRLRILEKTKIPSEFFEKNITEYYFKSAEHLKNYGVEIGVATGRNRFILPDGGLLVADVQAGKYQPWGGVALMQARQAVMPLSPTLLLAFNASVKRITYIGLDDHEVANTNHKLLKASREFYYQQP
jgi:hypothetical protein